MLGNFSCVVSFADFLKNCFSNALRVPNSLGPVRTAKVISRRH